MYFPRCGVYISLASLFFLHKMIEIYNISLLLEIRWLFVHQIGSLKSLLTYFPTCIFKILSCTFSFYLSNNHAFYQPDYIILFTCFKSKESVISTEKFAQVKCDSFETGTQISCLLIQIATDKIVIHHSQKKGTCSYHTGANTEIPVSQKAEESGKCRQEPFLWLLREGMSEAGKAG